MLPPKEVEAETPAVEIKPAQPDPLPVVDTKKEKKTGKKTKEAPAAKPPVILEPPPEYHFKHDIGVPETVLMVETAEILKELDDLSLEARRHSRKYKISGDPEDGIRLVAARDRYRELWEATAGRRIPMRAYWALFTIL